MRICFVIPRMQVGGAERIVVELCRGLSERGHAIAVMSEGGPMAEKLPYDRDVRHYVVQGMATRDPRQAIFGAVRLAKAIGDFKPEVINPHSYICAVITAAARILAFSKAASCFTLHVPEKNSYYQLIGRSIPWVAEEISAPCQKIRHELIAHGVPEHLAKVMYYGIDPHLLRSWPDIETIRPPDPVASVKIGVLARLIERKGIQLLIEAIGNLRRKGNTRFTVEIAGEGPYKPELERLIELHEVRAQIQLVGRRDDIAAFLDSLDLFVLPSYFEGLPVSILEAFARGIPVIAAAVDGVPEAVIESGTGFLIPSGNVPALVRALLRVLEEPQLLPAIRKNARTLISDRFLTHHMVARYEAWFNQVQGKKMR